MSIPLIVAGTTYNFPESGTDPNWGPAVTDWATAVTEVLNSIIGPGDILPTEYAISNNISIDTNVNGLLFDPGTVRAASISYSLYRTSTANPAGNAETGTIFIVYDDSAGVGQKWQFAQTKDGWAGVSFSITDLGQVIFTSNDIGALGYSGVMKFSAKSLSK